jgi:DNA-directed RNA polymerase specialized sigma24 family protein
MSQSVKSDADLLREARRDPKAFRSVYERHVARVFSLLRHETGDVDVAMDLTAETFARALAGTRRFRPARIDESAAPWLFGIARNVLREHRRERRAVQQTRERLGIERWSYDREALEEVDERLDAAAVLPELSAALDALTAG